MIEFCLQHAVLALAVILGLKQLQVLVSLWWKRRRNARLVKPILSYYRDTCPEHFRLVTSWIQKDPTMRLFDFRERDYCETVCREKENPFDASAVAEGDPSSGIGSPRSCYRLLAKVGHVSACRSVLRETRSRTGCSVTRS